jgi:nucleoside-diphosphate-sugar epimerase
MELAEMIRSVVGRATEIVTTPSDDNRSYHISSEKIRRELGFVPTHTIEDAARSLVDGFMAGRIPDPMTDIRYYNIKTMQTVHLT